MSRTTRYHYRKGLMRDRTRKEIYAAGSCARHGGCGYCEGNRTHKFSRAQPVIEVDYDLIMPRDLHFNTDWAPDDL